MLCLLWFDPQLMPDGSSKEECFAWIESLPPYTSPTWIGLDANAEKARAERIAKSVSKKVQEVEIARSALGDD